MQIKTIFQPVFLKELAEKEVNDFIRDKRVEDIKVTHFSGVYEKKPEVFICYTILCK